jgi:hypothetical protein
VPHEGNGRSALLISGLKRADILLAVERDEYERPLMSMTWAYISPHLYSP